MSVIVHGSVGFGDYVVGRSDLDLLIVGDLPADGLRVAAEALLDPPVAPGCRGLECSVVSLDDIADLTPLRPFRVHATVHDGHRRIVPGPGHPGDQDLTLHYAVARTSGITLWGAPACEVIPAQPADLVTQAMVSELRWATEAADPFYAVLTAARALAFATEGVMLSKLGGWLWARRHGGPGALLDAALSSYLAADTSTVDSVGIRELLERAGTALRVRGDDA
jgi:hypothetical protein